MTVGAIRGGLEMAGSGMPSSTKARGGPYAGTINRRNTGAVASVGTACLGGRWCCWSGRQREGFEGVRGGGREKGAVEAEELRT